MSQLHRGKNSIVFPNRPAVVASAAVGGKKEAEGPLGSFFDHTEQAADFGQSSWEKAEMQLQQLALSYAVKKAGMQRKALGCIFAGDLLNQCIASSFAARDSGVPFLGLYGACSTMAESLLLAACAVEGGFVSTAAALTSSHFASAERQYRFPLCYGSQRTPTAQWTVTGAGCCIVAKDGKGPRIEAATVGAVTDLGITDANNMGAAMAPAAYDTISRHFSDLGRTPADYDLIVTGDLGSLGAQIVLDFFQKDGVALQNVYNDCGAMIFNPKKQDVHAGGSGCGCSASVLCGHLLPRLREGSLKRLLFCATGALLSPISAFQGESIPAICHAVSITAEGV